MDKPCRFCDSLQVKYENGLAQCSACFHSWLYKKTINPFDLDDLFGDLDDLMPKKQKPINNNKLVLENKEDNKSLMGNKAEGQPIMNNNKLDSKSIMDNKRKSKVIKRPRLDIGASLNKQKESNSKEGDIFSDMEDSEEERELVRKKPIQQQPPQQQHSKNPTIKNKELAIKNERDEEMYSLRKRHTTKDKNLYFMDDDDEDDEYVDSNNIEEEDDDDEEKEYKFLDNEDAIFNHSEDDEDEDEETEVYESKMNAINQQEAKDETIVKRKIERKAGAKPTNRFNPFILFNKEVRAKMKKEHPELDNYELSKCIGQQWKELDPVKKEAYNKLSERKKEDYKNRPIHFAKRPKPPPNVWIVYSKEEMPKVRAKHPGLNVNEAIFLLLFSLSDLINSQQLGSIQTSVPWKAGHASAYIYPYVILYGGSQDPSANYGTTTLSGSNSLWVWDSRNGSWYNPTVQVQSGVEMLPQVYIKATNLPSQGQLLTWVGNTTSNSVLQKLDINSWSWSFPTTNFQASTAKVAGYSIVTVDNTIYTYGGLAVDNNGYPNTNAVQNTLSFLDASSFQVSTGSNGIGLTDHTTCYLKKLNSLITFGGSTTGSSTGVTDAVNIYNLSSNVWNVQGLSTLIAPAARRLHTANCLDDFMIVFGGGTSQPFDSDIWILNATSYPNMFWQRMSVANQTESPNPRMGHSSVLDSENNKLYIFGGWGVTGTNDSSMYVLDISHWSWTKVPTTGYAKNQVTSPSIPPLNTTVTTGTSENHQNKAGIIAGATVGGVVFLALLVLALFFFKRRSRKEQEKDVTSSTHEDEQYVDKTSLPSDNYGRPPYRMSKAWSSTSFAKHSEIGDYSDRVVTGVLEAVTDAGTVAATHGSSRDSFRHSKTLLEIGPGQVPNEIISQKPNEFSVLIRPKHDLQVDHHRAALDDEDWTLPDSPLSPVQYIQTSSKPSIGTNSTWDTTEARRKAVTHHHPSSSIITNTPVAQTVHIPQEEEQSRPELYNRMSPLDLLASLGQHHHTESSGQSNSSGESFTILKSPSTSSSISDGLLTPIISLLPKRYQIDPTLPPIIGPSNSILFANDNNTKRPVTIKLFGRREAWERECRALTKLKSPWVVELVEVLTLQKKENEEEVKYVIVMERLSETLNRKKNIMPQEVASHLLRALAYCHNYRIAFCDLKPSNVMYVDGTWKLIDFEASRTIEEECVGVMTPRYCAPEVARATTYGLEGASGVVATASVDLWSLGCLIYELETQKSLFPNNIKDETILHFTSHPSPSTPILSNGLRWNEQQELEIPQLDKLIQNEHTRHIIKTLLSRDPLYRGSAQQWMQDTYFNY